MRFSGVLCISLTCRCGLLLRHHKLFFSLLPTTMRTEWVQIFKNSPRLVLIEWSCRTWLKTYSWLLSCPSFGQTVTRPIVVWGCPWVPEPRHAVANLFWSCDEAERCSSVFHHHSVSKQVIEKSKTSRLIWTATYDKNTATRTLERRYVGVARVWIPVHKSEMMCHVTTACSRKQSVQN